MIKPSPNKLWIRIRRNVMVRWKPPTPAPLLLRDKLVCGVKEFNRLLAERNLTYDKTMELALTQEAANKDRKEHLGQMEATDSGRVHFTLTGFQKKSLTCYRCGGPRLANECQYWNTEYVMPAKRRGHIAKVCRTTTQEKSHSKQTEKPPKKPPIQDVCRRKRPANWGRKILGERT